jgi:hypothetical protein
VTPQSRPGVSGCQSAALRVALVLGAAAVLAGGGCGRRSDGGLFLTRPEPARDGRVAFVSQSRVWIADAGQAYDRRAVPVPIDIPADRPRWIADSTGATALAMNLWFDGRQAELAYWNGNALDRLTLTPEDELLDDAAADGRLLFEQDGVLCEARIERSAGVARLGTVTRLVPGRDGRYTPDGRHVLFVRGHESDPLGIWHQGYQGGDDSEVYFLDLATLAVAQITDNPDNDELPIPLDNAGQLFIVCRERGGLGYRPWIVDVITPKKHRVRRLPMPEGPWPVVFPAVRWLEPPKSRLAALVARDTTMSLEVWAESDGKLVMTRGEIQPSKLAFPAPEPVQMRLMEAPAPMETLAAEDDWGPISWGRLNPSVAEELWLAIRDAVLASPFAKSRWDQSPGKDRVRFENALHLANSEPERTEIILRLLGRCGLPGFDYRPPSLSPAKLRAISRPGAIPSPRLLGNNAGIYLCDLRGWIASMSPGWNAQGQTRNGWATRLCADGWYRGRRGIVMIDERTTGDAEILAAALRAGGCATLVGRTTSGLAMMGKRHPIRLRAENGRFFDAVLTVPDGQVWISPSLILGPEGVIPDQLVRAGASEEEWQAAVNQAREQLRK